MPERWTLGEIAKTYGTKRRTLLEWCANGKWRDKARKEIVGNREQWVVPDEVVQAEYRTAVVEASTVPPTTFLEAVTSLQAKLDAQEMLLQEILRRLPNPDAKRMWLIARIRAVLNLDKHGH